MTNQEAIEILTQKLYYAEIVDWYCWALGEKDKEALAIAIKAIGEKL